MAQMGPRYVAYRAYHEVRRRSGMLRSAFPTSFAPAASPSLQEWRESKPAFFVPTRAEVRVTKRQDPELQDWYERFVAGDFQYFSYEWKHIGRDYNWRTNPTTGYTYGLEHWTEIPDLDPERGDVKYVWEKSRFSYLLQLIRYDYHYGEDQSELVFSEIESWLDANPLNLGPNYLCSQEISLRLLNWTFALYYYQDSEAMTQVRWERVMQSMYGQLKHVRAHIRFSRIAVRNNHAITETLMLYVGGLLFPWFSEAAEWKKSGKAWFEQEVEYQVYEDGTYIQHSHNYQRVLTQLLSYALAISRVNGENFSDIVRSRAMASLRYLTDVADLATGELPNYGSNDGALFFPLATQSYRDYRAQLNGLSRLLNGRQPFPKIASEEGEWLVGDSPKPVPDNLLSLSRRNHHAFATKGVYLHRNDKTLQFINCGSYRDRPFQADNLHFDLWIKGINVLRDAGSYRYNTDANKLKYFVGSAGHNTVMLGDHDQMLRIGRFIWTHWSRSVMAEFNATENGYQFTGEIIAFGQVASSIRHRRQINYNELAGLWMIEDTVTHNTDNPVVQHWNLHPNWANYLSFSAVDEHGRALEPNFSEGYFSGHYGELSPAPHLTFATRTATIRTTITLLTAEPPT